VMKMEISEACLDFPSEDVLEDEMEIKSSNLCFSKLIGECAASGRVLQKLSKLSHPIVSSHC